MFRLRKNKPIKIRSWSDSTKYGVAAGDVKELLKKGCKLLQVRLPPAGAHVCLYSDGTKVTEEFFRTLPDHTELVLLSRDQTWSGGGGDFFFHYKIPGTIQKEEILVEAAKGLLSDEQTFLPGLISGVNARFQTKSAYMKFSCESRIRSYMKEVVDATNTIQTARVRAELVKASKCLVEMLKTAKYNSCYFDRTDKEPNRLCTPEGWFTCQGSFDQDMCQSLHSINPYSSQESRIIFSTWNLDHRIEKKRTVVPALLEALQNHRSADINLNYFYRLLFTRENLKLVHIVCHKKGAHNLQCDRKEIYKQTINTDNSKQKAKRKKRRLL
uniref:DNA fragmentation factor subunit beta n=1 Tax=Mola mola TaxID=94237 RepID=A0A3Q3X9Y4_MOLML